MTHRPFAAAALAAAVLAAPAAVAQDAGNQQYLPAPSALEDRSEQLADRYLARINDVMDRLYRQMAGPWQEADIPRDARAAVNQQWTEVLSAWEAVRRAEGDRLPDALRTYETELNRFTTLYEHVIDNLQSQQAEQQQQ